ncbi:MAG: cyanophycinase [Candidatus Marinimicrobia bacterium]|nr:cyanophycinase [Candidatus Neomarinimicrobiota bacterium]
MKKPNNRLSRIDEYIPQGLLVAIGGREDKKEDLEILSTLVSLVDAEVPKIEIITTATNSPEETSQEYIAAFSREGKNSIGILNIDSREAAVEPELLERIKAADIIFFTGGDQLRITSILAGSPIIDEIKRRYLEEHCIIAGTSAGAAAMSRTMIYGGDSSEALKKGSVNLGDGIGLIDNVIIDTHFVERGRFSRLMQVLSINPTNVGIGLGEDTGIIIEKGHIIKAIGNGLVVIFDGQDLKYSNVADIRYDEAIAMENLTVHTIVDGYGYDLRARKYLRPGDLNRITGLEKRD